MYLFDWLNVNCIRTSHYPYAEEFYHLADQMGIAVFDEVPAVGFKVAENFNKVTLVLHKQLLQELYNRDKNHPSVIMWSLANEPSSDLDPSVAYFALAHILSLYLFSIQYLIYLNFYFISKKRSILVHALS